jgi:hypothetical protein
MLPDMVPMLESVDMEPVIMPDEDVVLDIVSWAIALSERAAVKPDSATTDSFLQII